MNAVFFVAAAVIALMEGIFGANQPLKKDALK
jgi:hypothetical protein